MGGSTIPVIGRRRECGRRDEGTIRSRDQERTVAVVVGRVPSQPSSDTARVDPAFRNPDDHDQGGRADGE